MKLDHILLYLKKIDREIKINKEYNDKYSLYLDGNEKVIVNEKNKTLALLLSRGLLIPLEKKR